MCWWELYNPPATSTLARHQGKSIQHWYRGFEHQLQLLQFGSEFAALSTERAPHRRTLNADDIRLSAFISAVSLGLDPLTIFLSQVGRSHQVDPQNSLEREFVALESQLSVQHAAIEESLMYLLA